MKIYFLYRYAAICSMLLLTNCSDSSSSAAPPIPDIPDFEVVVYEPVAIAKSNPTKTYMHYMPWFETNESSADKKWGYHWTMVNKNPNNIDTNGKREIASHYYPLIGPYHSGDMNVIEFHLLLLKYAGVDGLLFDWYGSYDLNDYAINKENTEQVIAMLEKVGIDYAIVYEDRFLDNIVNAGLAPTQISAAKNDMKYLQSNYFKDQNYIKIADKPLLLNFGPITLQQPENWTDVFSVLSPKPTFLTLWYESADAGINAQGEYAWVYQDNSHLTNFYNNRLETLGVAFGSAYPGFKDYYKEGGAGDNIGFTIEHKNGETFEQTLQLAKSANLDYLQLITWNDFGEGTMIEPTEEFGFTSLEKLKVFSEVQNTGNAFSAIHELYLLRKAKKSDAEIQKKLDQVFYYFVSMQPSKAINLLNEID